MTTNRNNKIDLKKRIYETNNILPPAKPNQVVFGSTLNTPPIHATPFVARNLEIMGRDG